MPGVDAHAVTRHGVLDLVDDGPPCSFDAEYRARLNNVVRGRLLADDTYVMSVGHTDGT